MSNSTWEVEQGLDATFDVDVRDSQGNLITTYTGGEALDGLVWPGQDMAQTFALFPVWVDPSVGLTTCPVTAADTLNLGVGNYRVRLNLTDAGANHRPYYTGILSVTASAAAAVLAPTYCSYQDMLDLAGWIGDLQDALHDETGFAKQRAAARIRLDSIILHSYRGHTVGQFGEHSNAAFSWAYGGGKRRSVLTSPIIRTWLASNFLMVRDEIRTIQAHWSIANVCLANLASGANYISFGAWHQRQGDMMAASATAELDINGDGFAEIGVPLGATNTLFT